MARLRWLIPLSILFSTFLPAVSHAEDEADKIYDARLEGYGSRVTLDSSSTALMWLLLILLAVPGLGVLFMNAKRSHLD